MGAWVGGWRGRVCAREGEEGWGSEVWEEGDLARDCSIGAFRLATASEAAGIDSMGGGRVRAGVRCARVGEGACRSGTWEEEEDRARGTGDGGRRMTTEDAGGQRTEDGGMRKRRRKRRMEDRIGDGGRRKKTVQRTEEDGGRRTEGGGRGGGSGGGILIHKYNQHNIQ